MRLLLIATFLSAAIFAQTVAHPPTERKAPEQAPKTEKQAEAPAVQKGSEAVRKTTGDSPAESAQQSAAKAMMVELTDLPESPMFIEMTGDKGNLAGVPSQSLCSIPLLNVLGTETHDRIATTQQPAKASQMPQVNVPAPPCKAGSAEQTPPWR